MKVLVPKITIHDLAFSEMKDSIFRAASIEIKSAKTAMYIAINVFLLQRKRSHVPIAMIRDFKFAMAVDSIKLIDADITYEEFLKRAIIPDR
jgi:hypothetical protein